MARSRAFAGMKWKFFGARKRRERTFIHNLCPLCGRRRGASSADRVGRGPCAPPGQMRCSAAGHAGPALQGAAVIRGGQSRPPLHVLCGTSYPKGICSAALHCRTPSPTHLVIASQSAPRSKCPWGTDWRGNPFPQRSPPLDKPVGMGIIVDVRGRCDKRSAPQQLNDYFELFSSQKPSPCRVAVSAFQSLDSYRDRMTQNMNRENEKHVCHPLSGP